MAVPIVTYEQIESWVGGAFWPFLRIGACLMVAPLFSASYIPARVRIVLAGALTLVVLPMIARPQGLTVLSVDGVVTTVQQIVIGAALGFVLRLLFDAVNLGGQFIANGMGLGLALNIDPLLDVETPALGQLYGMLASLTFLALDGHIALIDTLVTSFRGLPVGPIGFSSAAMRSLADWGDQLFIGALRIALPGVTALLVVNLAFGLPITLVFGLLVLFFGLPNMQTEFVDLLKTTFQYMHTMVEAR
jgi:flagellar biosynthetic protein FliR